MSVTEWVFKEYDSRIRSGMSSADAASEVKGLIDEHDRVYALWEEQWETLLSHIYAEGLRNNRRELTQAKILVAAGPVAVAGADSTHTIFGEQRINVAVLQQEQTIFEAMVMVGNRVMRYGDMTRDHWELKAHQYMVSADNAGTRHKACQRIIKRLVGDMSTEESFSAEEFQRMIPEVGF